MTESVGTGITTFVDEGLGNAFYLIDLGEGNAIVVDPPRDTRRLLRNAEDRELRVRFVLDTHLHNDYVSGNLELAARGATVILPRAASADFGHIAVEDEDEVEANGAVVRVIATPGHTPEHMSYLLLDEGVPVALFSGGALLRRAVARTDLLGDESARPLAQALFASIHQRLLTLPDDVLVFPTHGAGATFCAVAEASDGEVATSIGEERRENEFVRLADAELFADTLLKDPSPFPTHFRHLRAVNRLDRAVYGSAAPTLPRLASAEVQAAEREGARIVDVRGTSSFAAGHIHGALSIELRPAFATWLGWLVEHRRPLVFVIGDEQDRAELVWQCRKIGFEALVGELAGGMEAWVEEGLPRKALLVEGEADSGATFLDVRHAHEYERAHLRGAVNIDLGELADSMHRLPVGPLTVYCGSGQRAATAASLLESVGRDDVSIIDRPMREWAQRARLELEQVPSLRNVDGASSAPASSVWIRGPSLSLDVRPSFSMKLSG
jgi:hydroxyacylglutathione hydrolase